MVSQFDVFSDKFPYLNQSHVFSGFLQLLSQRHHAHPKIIQSRSWPIYEVVLMHGRTNDHAPQSNVLSYAVT